MPQALVFPDVDTITTPVPRGQIALIDAVRHGNGIQSFARAHGMRTGISADCVATAPQATGKRRSITIAASQLVLEVEVRRNNQDDHNPTEHIDIFS